MKSCKVASSSASRYSYCPLLPGGFRLQASAGSGIYFGRQAGGGTRRRTDNKGRQSGMGAKSARLHQLFSRSRRGGSDFAISARSLHARPSPPRSPPPCCSAYLTSDASSGYCTWKRGWNTRNTGAFFPRFGRLRGAVDVDFALTPIRSNYLQSLREARLLSTSPESRKGMLSSVLSLRCSAYLCPNLFGWPFNRPRMSATFCKLSVLQG